MINIPQMVTDIGATLPAWTIEQAWTMNPFDDNDYGTKQPWCALYQGDEIAAPRDGSPCHQSMNSAIVALVLCKHAELHIRLPELREALYGYTQDDHLDLYFADQEKQAAQEIKGEYIFWRDVWMTRYV